MNNLSSRSMAQDRKGRQSQSQKCRAAAMSWHGSLKVCRPCVAPDNSTFGFEHPHVAEPEMAFAVCNIHFTLLFTWIPLSILTPTADRAEMTDRAVRAYGRFTASRKDTQVELYHLHSILES